MHVVAEMVASVHSLEARIGDHVAIGDTLLVLESMKMEIPAIATGAGTLTEILVEEETSVEEGQTVAIVEG